MHDDGRPLRKIGPYHRIPCGNRPCKNRIMQQKGMDIGDAYYYFCSSACMKAFREIRTSGAAERVAAFKRKMELRNRET